MEITIEGMDDEEEYDYDDSGDSGYGYDYPRNDNDRIVDYMGDEVDEDTLYDAFEGDIDAYNAWEMG